MDDIDLPIAPTPEFELELDGQVAPAIIPAELTQTVADLQAELTAIKAYIGMAHSDELISTTSQQENQHG